MAEGGRLEGATSGFRGYFNLAPDARALPETSVSLRVLAAIRRLESLIDRINYTINHYPVLLPPLKAMKDEVGEFHFDLVKTYVQMRRITLQLYAVENELRQEANE